MTTPDSFQAAVDRMRTLIESDSEMYQAGFDLGVEKAEMNPNMEVMEVLDGYPKAFDASDVDISSPDAIRQDLVHGVGLFSGFITARTSLSIVEGASSV